MAIFTKKFWQIRYANWQITKFKYFYCWQNALKFVFAVAFVLPLCLVFVTIPNWFFEKLNDMVQDKMPSFLMIDENPEYLKMKRAGELREFMLKFQTWE